MKRLTLSLCVCLCFLCCGVVLHSCAAPHSEQWPILVAVEDYIEDHPDSALMVLEDVRYDDLANPAERAKYSLLYSMALDKNYIDLTDFATLQPALDYYCDKGTPTDKLRTYYYEGCVYMNQGNDSRAMTAFTNALKFGGASTDYLVKARLYVAQGVIFSALMSWEESRDAYLNASDMYYKVDRYSNYVHCLLRATHESLRLDDVEDALILIEKCAEYLSYATDDVKTKYYASVLVYNVNYKDCDAVRSALDDYKNNASYEYIDYIVLANAYSTIGEPEMALEYLKHHTITNNIDDQKRYYAILSEAYEKLPDYENALNAYRKFYNVYDKQILSVLSQGAQFIEERHALELKAFKERDIKRIVILLCIIIAFVLFAVILFVKKELKYRTAKQMFVEQEMEMYRLLFIQMEQERDDLLVVLKENKNLSNELKQIVKDRINLLNKSFAAYIAASDKEWSSFESEIEEVLSDQEKFMSSTSLLFTNSHPNFIDYLKSHDLTDGEIAYCCLYAIGLNGRAVGKFMKKRGHYNISSECRRKLGLSNSDTNLGIYINKLLRNG